MSKRVVGLILNLIVSVGIGLFAGEKFYALFDKLVPAGAMTELMRTGSHTTYLFTGSLFGLVIFAWTALAVWLGRFFPGGDDDRGNARFVLRCQVTAFTPALAAGTLRGKIAWITGGGSGLGRAMAIRFASLGASVALSGRRVEPLQQVAAEIEAAGGKAATAPCDVREFKQVDAALASIQESLGVPDILVNNAAGNFLCPSEELTPHGFDAVVRIVLHGTFHCTRAAGRLWIEKKQGGTVLSIATTYAHTGSGFVLPSACAKAGVVALTRSLAVEWARHGIRLNAIAPGPIPTEGAFSRLLPTPALENARKRRIPAGRFGTQDELAELAAFLVCDASDWMRGEIVTFDGGEWLRGAGEFNDILDLPPEMIAALKRK